MSDDLLKAEADARHALHLGHTTSRPLSKDYELVGLAGEKEFAIQFNQPMDWGRKPKGDGGVDFVIPIRFTVDVKTARAAYNLIVERGKVAADIYVLAEYTDGPPTNAHLWGWAFKGEVLSAPVRDFGYGITNHYIPRDSLRPMGELRERVMHLK